ncbi:MAG: ABC transporter substrate-binding protein [Xanthobacteraceae bacterium]|jgi:polar amino acid transport system substrate-binding protein
MYRALGAAIIGITVGTATALAQSAVVAPPDVVKELAPTGTLRAAINAGNVVLVQKDPSGGDPRGITVDLARELGRRLGVPVDLVVYDTAGKVTDAVKNAGWDICFLAIEPARAAVIGFTAPYVIIEGTYMVSVDSPLKAVADVDRDGVRIAVSRGSAYDLYLSRMLQHATLVRYPSPPLAFQGFLADKLDAAAGVKQQLVQFAKSNPNVRVMDGRFQEIREAMGAPLGHDAGVKYLRSFVEEMKASGFAKKALERAGQPDALVAPAAEN